MLLCVLLHVLAQELPYDAKSDIWALGVVLYECVMRRHPFEAKSQVGAGSRHESMICMLPVAMDVGGSWLLLAGPSPRHCWNVAKE